MRRSLFLITLFFFLVGSVPAQTTEFTYQGNLKDRAAAANGSYDFEFALFDSLTGGTQQGSTLSRTAVAVSAGAFSVKLDFGPQFPGAGRFLEIHVRPAGSGSFTVLAPRQQISNTPYSVRSLNAANADNATNATNAATATNSLQLGGVAANQYVVTTDPRMADARSPIAGSGNYIQNGTIAQGSSNFNISGSGKADVFDAGTQFNLGGARILSNAGNGNLFAGTTAGSANSGSNNAFFGTDAGRFNTLGSSNTFVGASAGSSGDQGGNNTFIGAGAGFNSFGSLANGNTYIGSGTGTGNTSGRGNTMIGFQANTPFPSAINNATAIGQRALVTQDNSLVLGSINGTNGATTDTNVGIGTTAPTQRLHVVGTSLFAGDVTVTGTLNATLPSNSASYIQNTTSLQTTSAFNISGNGLIGGRFGVGITAPLFKLHVIDPSNTGLRVQTNTAGGTVASFGGIGAFQIDAPGVNGGRLQVSENGNVGIGTNAPTEKLTVNGSGRFVGDLNLNGTFSLGGSSGQAGQVITSNGTSAPQWKSSTNALYQQTNMNSTAEAIAPAPQTPTLVPGLSQTVSVSGNAKLLVHFGVAAGTGACLGCSGSVAEIRVNLNGGLANRAEYEVSNTSHNFMSGSWLMSVGPGSYTIDIVADLLTGPSVTFGCGTGCGGYNSYLIVQVIPQ